MPWVQRNRLAGFALLFALSASTVALRRRRAPARTGIQHPNLSRLSSPEGKQVVLLGMVPLDLDGSSGRLVSTVMNTESPDVIIVQGPWQGGAVAMVRAGKWELEGYDRNRNWTDIGAAEPMVLPQEQPVRKQRSWPMRLLRGSPPAPEPRSSFVPLKVGSWVQHLLDHVEGEVAVALQWAAASGVRVRFLGPQEAWYFDARHVGKKGLQALHELLTEERRRNSQLTSSDIDVALMRAESRVREEFSRWVKDARSEVKKDRRQLPEQVLKELSEQVKVWAQRDVEMISKTLALGADGGPPPKKAVVIVSAERLENLEEAMVAKGYSHV